MLWCAVFFALNQTNIAMNCCFLFKSNKYCDDVLSFLFKSKKCYELLSFFFFKTKKYCYDSPPMSILHSTRGSQLHHNSKSRIGSVFFIDFIRCHRLPCYWKVFQISKDTFRTLELQTPDPRPHFNAFLNNSVISVAFVTKICV